MGYNYFIACKGCAAKRPGCQDTCPTYQRQRAEYDKRMDAERQRQNIAAGLNEQKYGAINRASKRLGRRKIIGGNDHG